MVKRKGSYTAEMHISDTEFEKIEEDSPSSDCS